MRVVYTVLELVLLILNFQKDDIPSIFLLDVPLKM